MSRLFLAGLLFALVTNCIRPRPSPPSMALTVASRPWKEMMIQTVTLVQPKTMMRTEMTWFLTRPSRLTALAQIPLDSWPTSKTSPFLSALAN